ncbi:MAG: hypothetical protein NWQ05_10075 [Burkholderiaceae bacterium]|nr:hypothetical protein [Burkholderiaceae bacterium]
MKKLKILMVAGAATMLSSCDLSQIPGLDGKLSIDDSKAVGAACRHSGRALEDCFTLNPNTHPAGVFDGWRDMNDYMLANEIDVVKPEIRNSAFKSGGPVSHGSAPPHATAQQGAVPPVEHSEEPAPLVQGRERWSPKSTAGTVAPKVDAPVVDAPAPHGKAEVSGSEPAAAEAPAPDAPSRPWERKTDPKKHT